MSKQALDWGRGMDYKLLFKTAMLAGEITARSGAETYRVEDTINRILQLSNFGTIESFATTTGIMVTLDDPNFDAITSVKRINNRSNNLNRIYQVNNVSRDLCEGTIDEKEAYKQLLHIKHCKEYNNKMVGIATILSTASFVILFGGGLKECFAAGITGCIMVLCSLLLRKRKSSIFFDNAFHGFFIAIVTMTCMHFLKGVNSDVVIISAIMPLVPGVPITNAIRDTLQGDYMSGLTRATEAFIVALGIAAGVGMGLGFYNFIQGGIFL